MQVKKSQLIILIVSALVVIALFQLPKMIVENEKDQNIATEKPTEQPSSNPELHSAHPVKISDKDKEILSSLRKNFLSVSDKGKKSIFADSIAAYYRRLNQFDSAAYYYDVTARLNPGVKQMIQAGDAWVDLAGFSDGKDQELNAEKGRAYYQSILDKDPKNFEAKNRLAMSYTAVDDAGSVMKGVKVLKEILKEDPNNEEALFNLGALNIQNGQYNKSVEYLQQVVRINPNHVTAWFNMGLAYMNWGKNKEAIEAFEKVKSLDQSPEVQSTVDSYLQQLRK